MRVTTRKAIFIAMTLCCIVVLLAHPETLSFGPVEEPHARDQPVKNSPAPMALPTRAPSSIAEKKERMQSPGEKSTPTAGRTHVAMTVVSPRQQEQAPNVNFNFSADAATLLHTIIELNSQQTIYNKERFPLVSMCMCVCVCVFVFVCVCVCVCVCV